MPDAPHITVYLGDSARMTHAAHIYLVREGRIPVRMMTTLERGEPNPQVWPLKPPITVETGSATAGAESTTSGTGLTTAGAGSPATDEGPPA